MTLKQLIINADDFNADAERNRGILKSSEEGILTSTSVPFFKDALINWSWLYIPLVILVVTGASNAGNVMLGFGYRIVI